MASKQASKRVRHGAYGSTLTLQLGKEYGASAKSDHRADELSRTREVDAALLLRATTRGQHGLYQNELT